MREFEIWMEGWLATGEHSRAQVIGRGIGDTFDEAVKDYMSKTPNHRIKENTRSKYRNDEDYQKRRSNWNIWGCNLFDNEVDARKFYG
jgi:hypothetical protein